MLVRTATPGDRPRVARVHEESVRGVDPGVYDRRHLDSWDHERDPEDYPVEDPDRTVLVAERGGTVVGFGQANHPEAELEACYVHPDHGDRGVGSALLAGLEGRLAGTGVDAVHLVASLNAVAFYEAAGYERVERTTVEGHDGVELPCLRMEKDLRAVDACGARDWGRLPA